MGSVNNSPACDPGRAGKAPAKFPVLPLLLLLLCLPALLACPTTEKRAYLAFGSSYAAGAGLSEYGDSYPSLFQRFLEERLQEELALRSFAVDDETTESMIADGQLAKGLAELRFRNQDDRPENDVLVITVQIGGEEMAKLLEKEGPCAPPAQADDEGCEAAVEHSMEGMRWNMPVILRALRVAAGPEAQIFILDYFNPYSDDEPPLSETADSLHLALNEMIAQAARLPEIDATLVDIAEGFKGRVKEMTTALGEDDERVPNEAGHAMIAAELGQTQER